MHAGLFVWFVWRVNLAEFTLILPNPASMIVVASRASERNAYAKTRDDVCDADGPGSVNNGRDGIG